jgi:hypothetical protein
MFRMHELRTSAATMEGTTAQLNRRNTLLRCRRNLVHHKEFRMGIKTRDPNAAVWDWDSPLEIQSKVANRSARRDPADRFSQNARNRLSTIKHILSVVSNC